MLASCPLVTSPSAESDVSTGSESTSASSATTVSSSATDATSVANNSSSISISNASLLQARKKTSDSGSEGTARGFARARTVWTGPGSRRDSRQGGGDEDEEVSPPPVQTTADNPTSREAAFAVLAGEQREQPHSTSPAALHLSADLAAPRLDRPGLQSRVPTFDSAVPSTTSLSGQAPLDCSSIAQDRIQISHTRRGEGASRPNAVASVSSIPFASKRGTRGLFNTSRGHRASASIAEIDSAPVLSKATTGSGSETSIAATFVSVSDLSHEGTAVASSRSACGLNVPFRDGSDTGPQQQPGSARPPLHSDTMLSISPPLPTSTTGALSPPTSVSDSLSSPPPAGVRTPSTNNSSGAAKSATATISAPSRSLSPPPKASSASASGSSAASTTTTASSSGSQGRGKTSGSTTVPSSRVLPSRRATASGHPSQPVTASTSLPSAPVSAARNALLQLYPDSTPAAGPASPADSRRHSVDLLATFTSPTNSTASSSTAARAPLCSPPISRSGLRDWDRTEAETGYSSLAADPRFRKTSLGSQTLLSNTGDLLPQHQQYHRSHRHTPSLSASTSAARPGGAATSASPYANISPTRNIRASQYNQAPLQAYPHQKAAHGQSQSVSMRPGGSSGGGQGGSDGKPRFDVPHEATRQRDREAQMNRKNELEAKIVLLGRQGVGKTSLVHRYMTGQFSSTLPTTIGASFLVKKLVMDGVKVRLQIWDTAGQERFRSMAPMYYRGANAAILVYDITNEESLTDIQVWLDELRRKEGTDLIIHIVGHKADLAPTHRRVSLDHAKAEITKWMAASAAHMNPASSLSVTDSYGGSSSGSTLFSRRYPSGGSADQRSDGETGKSGGLSSLGSFSLARSGSRGKEQQAQQLLHQQQQQQQQSLWKDVAISEVSAKEDEGIEDLFLTIASKLVEQKVEIETERTLRSKDSIMITDEHRNAGVNDPTRVWGCC